MLDRTTAIENLPCYLTVDEIRRYLGIGRTLAYSLLNDGTLPSIRLGRRIMVPRDQLQAVFEK